MSDGGTGIGDESKRTHAGKKSSLPVIQESVARSLGLRTANGRHRVARMCSRTRHRDELVSSVELQVVYKRMGILATRQRSNDRNQARPSRGLCFWGLMHTRLRGAGRSGSRRPLRLVKVQRLGLDCEVPARDHLVGREGDDRVGRDCRGQRESATTVAGGWRRPGRQGLTSHQVGCRALVQSADTLSLMRRSR